MGAPDPLASAAQEWYRKGTEALGRDNFDFAEECFANAIKMKPGHVLFRQVKHGASKKKYNDNGTGARMAGMKLMSIRGKAKKARMKEDWATADAACEEGLRVNPWDAQLYAELGEISKERDHGEIAAYAYKNAVALDLENIPYNFALAYILRDRGEYKEARACCTRILKVDNLNAEARSLKSQLDAEEVMDRGGIENAESTQDVKVDKPTNAYEEDRRARKGRGAEAAAPGESEEMDMRAAIRKDPENVALYEKLASFLREDRRPADALEWLDKALEISNNDTGILEQKEDVEIEIMKEKTQETIDRARKNPERERLQEKAATMKKELLTREVEVLASRIDRHPNDMKMRFELAERYRRTKQFVKAIPLLQQAVADSRIKEDALVSLGECFVRSGKMDLGRRQFEKSLETLNGKDKPDAFKTAHYWLGRIYEKGDKNELAENHYTEILSVDYEYRDVLKRLEEIQGGDEFGDIDDEDM